MNKYLILLGILLFGLSCNGAGNVDVDAERRKLLDADYAWSSASQANDLNRQMEVWAEDAIDFFPGMPMAKGKDAISQLIEQNQQRPGYQLTWVPTGASVAASGDLGYTYGTFKFTVNGSDGRPVSRGGNYVRVWKNIDGSWHCSMGSTVFGPG